MSKRQRGIRFLAAAVCALLLTLGCAAAETESGAFTVERIGQIYCYRDNTLAVEAPEGGEVTIEIRNASFVFRTLRERVEKGRTKIIWDGCGYNEERLTPSNYIIHAELRGDSGQVWEYEFKSEVMYSEQALLFALPSSDTVYLSDPKEWFVESKTISRGALIFEFRTEDGETPVYSFKRGMKNGRINKTTFDVVAGKKKVAPGQYLVRVYEENTPAYFREFTLNVAEKKPKAEAVTVTGPVMPEPGDSDERIWELMMQPAVVVDIKKTNHQNVFEEPNEKSRRLGQLHGQTQTLCVKEIRDDWALIEAWNHEEGAPVTGWVPLKKLKVVYPSTEYGLLLDKQKQTLTVFYHGERLDTVLVCTGRMLTDQLYQETSAGSFLTGEHQVDYSTNGKKYDFVIQYDGGNLIHQIPYAFGGGKKDFTDGQLLLGTKASHACIRIQAAPGPEAGVNAYWIWTHIPYHTRLIILDDPEEREGRKAILRENTVRDSAGAAEGVFFTGEAEADPLADRVVLTFGGDAVLGGREEYYRRKGSLIDLLSENGYEYPFSGMREIFASDDLTCVNLECVLKEDGKGEDRSKQWRFRGLPEYAAILPAGSVELVNIANNHTIDYGEAGYESTIRALEGVAEWCGTGRPTAVEVKGHLIGFGGCRETTYKSDPDVIHRDIQALKEMGCELIVYQCHWGKEYSTHHNVLQEAMARTCVREGANLVIGHHPHVVQGVDYIDGVPVVYSLGNLSFGGTIQLSSAAYDALVVQAIADFGGEKPEIRVRLIPVLVSTRAAERVNDFRPVPAEGEDTERILRKIQIDTGFRIP